MAYCTFEYNVLHMIPFSLSPSLSLSLSLSPTYSGVLSQLWLMHTHERANCCCCNFLFTYVREMSVFRNLFLRALLHCCERPVKRRKAMLGPPLQDGLYCMAWTVVAVWR